jgi:hypothetical protein
MTKAHHINEAMQWLQGALNCHLAGKAEGQAYLSGYVGPQIRDVRRHLAEARTLPAPRLP